MLGLLTTEKKAPISVGIIVFGLYLYLIVQFPYLGYVLGILATIVIFHEMGHFYAAKGVGMQPKEFSVGFGRILTEYRTKKSTISFRILPLGGFVRFDKEKLEHSNFTKNMWILAGGPLANMFTAALGVVILNLKRGVSFNVAITNTVSTVKNVSSFAVGRFQELLLIPLRIIDKVASPINGGVSATQQNGGLSQATSGIAESVPQEGLTDTLLMYFIFFSIVIGLFQLIPLYGLDGYQMFTQMIDKAGQILKRNKEFTVQESNFMKVYSMFTMSYLVFLSLLGVVLDISSVL